MNMYCSIVGKKHIEVIVGFIKGFVSDNDTKMIKLVFKSIYNDKFRLNEDGFLMKSEAILMDIH